MYNTYIGAEIMAKMRKQQQNNKQQKTPQNGELPTTPNKLKGGK